MWWPFQKREEPHLPDEKLEWSVYYIHGRAFDDKPYPMTLPTMQLDYYRGELKRILIRNSPVEVEFKPHDVPEEPHSGPLTHCGEAR